MTCKNCGQEAEAHFCSNCGQRTTVGKLTASSLATQLSEGVFQVNMGFFFTLKELFTRPGHSIREFLAGKRKNHFKPIGYAFLISTIYFLLSQALGTDTVLNDLVTGFASGGHGEESSASQIETLNWLANRYSYTILVFLPVYAVASFLAFKGTGYNIVEHIVLNAYIIGQQSLIYIVYAVASYLTGDTERLAFLMIVASIAYQFFVFWQFFSDRGRLQVLLRSILTYILCVLFLTPFIVGILWMFSVIE
ncbi:MAG: DUF3667 domain-containing protein [Saprospiraceae bacterium]